MLTGKFNKLIACVFVLRIKSEVIDEEPEIKKINPLFYVYVWC